METLHKDMEIKTQRHRHGDAHRHATDTLRYTERHTKTHSYIHMEAHPDTGKCIDVHAHI